MKFFFDPHFAPQFPFKLDCNFSIKPAEIVKEKKNQIYLIASQIVGEALGSFSPSHHVDYQG